VTKLIARGGGVQIKIEVTPVLRGTVFEAETRTVTPAVEDWFGFAEMKLVSFADLYAGKLVAALDRQHPRDLFDVRDLLANEGITEELRQAFIVYLLSHDRPMHEVIRPTLKDITGEYERGFAAMTEESVPLEALVDARELVTARQRRRALEHLTSLRVSQRRACRATGFSRSAAQYRFQPPGRCRKARPNCFGSRRGAFPRLRQQHHPIGGWLVFGFGLR
jgi:predicted nucleotidyltransferase component of viral defense system